MENVNVVPEPPAPTPPAEKRSTGTIIGTIAAILLCGLPGLCLLCPLSVYIFTGTMPDFTTGYGNLPQAWGILPLCISVLFIAIGVVVPILLLRKKKPVEAESVDIPPMPPQEPLPPAS